MGKIFTRSLMGGLSGAMSALLLGASNPKMLLISVITAFIFGVEKAISGGH